MISNPWATVCPTLQYWFDARAFQISQICTVDMTCKHLSLIQIESSLFGFRLFSGGVTGSSEGASHRLQPCSTGLLTSNWRCPCRRLACPLRSYFYAAAGFL
ncbi:uncharacterized protein VTP21DRAFT_2200 [Calcarisporiella thermophila]|uniref:uncharacterized protein n=1 Tax=Calcarisporiella thermophila TaxID=911321 RepID=UPI0037427358